MKRWISLTIVEIWTKWKKNMNSDNANANILSHTEMKIVNRKTNISTSHCQISVFQIKLGRLLINTEYSTFNKEDLLRDAYDILKESSEYLSQNMTYYIKKIVILEIPLILKFTCYFGKSSRCCQLLLM